LVEAHVQELHRSRQARYAQPIITNERLAPRRRSASNLPASLARAIERLAGQPAPEAHAL
jgi:hypothetical protein